MRFSAQDPEASQRVLDESRSSDHRHSKSEVDRASLADDTAELEDVEHTGEGQDRDPREDRPH